MAKSRLKILHKIPMHLTQTRVLTKTHIGPTTQIKNPQIMDLNPRVHQTKEIIAMGAITPTTPDLSNLEDRETTQCRIQGSEVGSFKGQAPTTAIKYGSTTPTKT